jgi:5-methyltetrahydrofolate--homocysteine methyltransferase
VPYQEAKERRLQIDWATTEIAEPSFTGIKTISEIPLEEIVPYIDWSPFFMAWELSGKYPKIFNDKVVGAQAQELFEDGSQLLEQIISDKLLTANSCYAFWPANSDGDDLVVFEDQTRTKELARFSMLRQQWERKGQKHFRSLADYVAPLESGREDYLGGFAVTTGIGCDELCKRFDAELDDYNSIMAKALADRLAEALAEKTHQQARIDWGFGSSEGFSNDDLIDEKYRGIRPAAGYPACPDHTEKATLFNLLSATNNTGIHLTESFAMLPAAAVSGLYFSHPEARYFSVDRITRDQVEDYARRKNESIDFVEKWLSPNLGY